MHALLRRSVVLALLAATVAVPSSVASASAPSTSAPASSSSAAAEVTETWQVGIRAGTTTFSSGPEARCTPKKVDATLAQRRCIVRVEGRFVSYDKGWKGRYEGRSTVVYPVQEEGQPLFDSAAFDSGNVSYFVREMDGTWVGRLDMYVDLGTGGVYGFPNDLDISYWIEERNEMVGRLEVQGVGVNKLNADLEPIRTFIDRLPYS